MTCHPFTSLCAADAETVFARHLADCPRCRAIASRVHTSVEVGPAAPAPEMDPASKFPKPGDVWTFWAPDWDEYLVGAVLDAGEVDLLIVPLVAETTYASDADILLDKDILGYAAIASVWAADHVVAEQRAEAVNVLSEQVLERLDDAYEAFFGGEPVPDPAGPAVITDADPRIAAHAALADDLRHFYAPWAMMHVAEELGPVIARRRDELGVEVEALFAEGRAWKKFERGEADPYTTIPVKTIADATRTLGLLASCRLVDLAKASVFAHHQGEALYSAPAAARRRRGVTQRPQRDLEAAATAADRYAASLAKELGL